MFKTIPRNERLVLACAWVSALLAACSTGSAPETANHEVGRTTVKLSLPDGSQIAHVSWTITGGGLAAPRTGEIDVEQDETVVSVLISDIPVASDYTLELNTLTDTGTLCDASADFDIPSAGATVAIELTLSCDLEPSASGDLVVTAGFDTCRTLDSLVIAPVVAAVGDPIDLAAGAGDDHGDTLELRWSASAGIIDTPTQARARFTCTVVGPVTIDLEISGDDDCNAQRRTEVTCVANNAETTQEPDPDAGQSMIQGTGQDDDAAIDNCPVSENARQADADGDGTVDACDSDRDGDGFANEVDTCPDTANADQADQDADGVGDSCDQDVDGDGVVNTSDNCPFETNADQLDQNSDGVGDACTAGSEGNTGADVAADTDNDGVADAEDNCPNASNADQADFDGDGAGDTCDPIYYTGGHGDLGFEFEMADSELEIRLHVVGATVDGVSDVLDEFPLEPVHLVTHATFTRPAPDDGVFAPLCVEPGESVFWLPQGNSAATTAGVPFLGIANEVPSGVFIDDMLDLALVDVVSPTGSGAYSLWKDGFPPEFYLASCDGIDSADVMSIPAGHDHFNMGFANDSAGTWEIRYRVSGALAADGSIASQDFSVYYDIR